MKKTISRNSKICISLAFLLIGIGFGLMHYQKTYKMPLKDYTASCLYLAVMDDEIARNNFQGQTIGGTEVSFPAKAESLQYRYHLHLSLQKGKTVEQMAEEIATYERLLKESRLLTVHQES